MRAKHIHTERTIHGPIAKVWQTLVAVDNYPSWNPFIIQVHRDGPATACGTKLQFRIQWPSGTMGRSVERVTQVEPPMSDSQGIQTALWRYDYCGLPKRLGLLRVTRVQTLIAQGPARTKYTSVLRFEGVAKHWIPHKNIRQGCALQARALAHQFSSP